MIAPAPPPPGSLRQAQRALTRDRLRRGARSVFAEKPYLDATIDEIAARAGVARATFYLHYDGKDALLRDLLTEDMQAHRRLYHRLADLGAEPTVAALADWVRLYMKVFDDHRASVTLFNVVIGSDPGFMRDITEARDALFDDVATRTPAFAFPPGPDGARRRVAAHLLVFKIEQFCHHAIFAAWPEATLALGVDLLARELRAFLLQRPEADAADGVAGT